MKRGYEIANDENEGEITWKQYALENLIEQLVDTNCLPIVFLSILLAEFQANVGIQDNSDNPVKQ